MWHLKNEGRSIFPRSSHYSISVSLRKQGTKANCLEATGREWFPRPVLPASVPQAQAPPACWALDNGFVPGDFRGTTLKSQLESSPGPRSAHCTVATGTAERECWVLQGHCIARLLSSPPRVPGPSPPGPWSAASLHSLEHPRSLHSSHEHSRNLMPWAHSPTYKHPFLFQLLKEHTNYFFPWGKLINIGQW